MGQGRSSWVCLQIQKESSRSQRLFIWVQGAYTITAWQPPTARSCTCQASLYVEWKAARLTSHCENVFKLPCRGVKAKRYLWKSWLNLQWIISQALRAGRQCEMDESGGDASDLWSSHKLRVDRVFQHLKCQSWRRNLNFGCSPGKRRKSHLHRDNGYLGHLSLLQGRSKGLGWRETRRPPKEAADQER